MLDFWTKGKSYRSHSVFFFVPVTNRGKYKASESNFSKIYLSLFKYFLVSCQHKFIFLRQTFRWFQNKTNHNAVWGRGWCQRVCPLLRRSEVEYHGSIQFKKCLKSTGTKINRIMPRWDYFLIRINNYDNDVTVNF